MRLMYDSIDPYLIPASAQMIALYANGAYEANSEEVHQHYPNAILLHIDVNGSAPDHAAVLDVERYDATPDIAAEWIRQRNKLHPNTATIYCNASTLPSVEEACKGEHYHRWIADWTGHPHGYPGAVAVQYVSTSSYDISSVWDNRWHTKSYV